MTIEEMNKKDVNDCYEVDVFRPALSLQGIKELPWPGYDEALLLSHSRYISENISYLETGIYGSHGKTKTIKGYTSTKCCSKKRIQVVSTRFVQDEIITMPEEPII